MHFLFSTGVNRVINLINRRFSQYSAGTHLVLMAVLTVCFLSFTSAEAQPAMEARSQLARNIGELIGTEDFQNSLWGITIRDLDTGLILYSRNGVKSFMPASNTKLYTTAAGLHYLGPGFRYRTSLYYDGEIRDGVLHGNLIVRGSGDPVIGGRFNDDDRTELFRQWADTLRSAGIRMIRGDIIGDGTIFNSPPLGNSWSWDYLTYWYAAEHGGLSFNDNCVDAIIIGTREGRPARILLEPHNTSYVEIENHTLTVHADSSRRISYNRPIGTNRITIGNHVPEGDTIRYSLSVPNPALYFSHVFRETLLLEGIPVHGRPADVTISSVRPDYDRLNLITFHESPPLSEIIKVINTVSQNMYAETLLMTVGTYIPADDDPEDLNSHQLGLLRQLEFLGSADVDTSRILLVDGSGLSRRNLVTPNMTAALLHYMWNLPEGELKDAFMNSLPLGGDPDGTLRNMFQEGPAAMRVRAKTGTIGGARALSGYVRGKDGRTFAFSMMSNNHMVPVSRVNAVMELIVHMLADYPDVLTAGNPGRM
jgi:serine-type D-Ala-D-Ala carboxypeptidase/endopeptidase (penicillin-binding protein 4)